MGLNKNGWSLKEMVIFSSILFAFLLIAIFNIMRMYQGLHSENTSNSSNSQNNSEVNYSYKEIENFVLEAGFDYYNLYYNLEPKVKISISKMKRQGLIKSSMLKPSSEQKECDGYVLFDEGTAKAFIDCQKYKTNGFEE